MLLYFYRTLDAKFHLTFGLRILNCKNSGVAQSAERLAVNQRATGSSPVAGVFDLMVILLKMPQKIKKPSRNRGLSHFSIIVLKLAYCTSSTFVEDDLLPALTLQRYVPDDTSLPELSVPSQIVE